MPYLIQEIALARQNSSWIITVLVAVVAIAGYFVWESWNGNGVPEGFAVGNGRIEAVEIDVAAKTPGRIDVILVREGDFVTAGQDLVILDTKWLMATKRQAEAGLTQAEIAVENAGTLIVQREAEKRAAEAGLAQMQARLDAAQKQFERTEQLATSSILSQSALDGDRAAALGAQAGVSASEAALAASDAAIRSAHASVISAQAAVAAAKAAIEIIDVEIQDSTLTAPRDGRVQYLIAREGEIVAPGGRVVNLVDLTDVYMTFFLPTEQAGRIGIGTEVQIFLDAAPQLAIPANVSFVADVAQFTPKTVETQVEREKLMFRIRARIDPDLLRVHVAQVKTGLPGVAWVQLDPNAPWPTDIDSQLFR